MDSSPQRTERIADLEAWWALIARVLAFFLGGAILTFETAFEAANRIYLIVAAIGLMGPTVAASVASVFRAIRGQNGAT